jgi:hypothetical protein
MQNAVTAINIVPSSLRVNLTLDIYGTYKKEKVQHIYQKSKHLCS